MRRTGIVLAVVVFLIIVLLAGYFFAYRPATDAPSDEGPVSGVGALPPSGGTLPSGGASGAAPAGGSLPTPSITLSDAKQRFGVVAQNPVLDYHVDPQNVVTIVQPDGVIVRISKGTPVTLSSKEILGIIRGSLSVDGKRALLVFGDPASPQASVFDVESKTWVPLSPEVKNPAWAPDGRTIAFFSQKDAEFGVLATMDVTAAKPSPRALLQLHAQDLVISWPSPDALFLSEKPASFTRSTIWKYDVRSGTLSFAGGFYGFSATWNGSGTRGVAFSSNNTNRGGSAYFISSDNQILRKFDAATLPSKCAFLRAPAGGTSTPNTTGTRAANESVVCGFIANTQDFNLAPQPDSYLQRETYTADRIYRADLETGDVQNLFPEGAHTFDVWNPKVFGEKFFFVNRYDNRLYALSLPGAP